MRLRVGCDEFHLYYVSFEGDHLGGDVVIELSARDYAEYRHVAALHEMWQRKLHQLWLLQQHGMNG